MELTLERARGRNIKGIRRSWKNDKDAKMTAGSRSCPDAEYATKEMTEANTGSEKATALLPDRINKSDRMYLRCGKNASVPLM